jgi:hypothetical protein
MKDNAKIYFKALVVGLPLGVLSSMPWLMTGDALDFLAILSLPGFVVGLAISRGNIHSINISAIVVGNLVLYPIFVYVVLYLLNRVRTAMRKTHKLS